MLDHGSKIFSLFFLALFPQGYYTATMPEIFDYIVVGGGTAGKPSTMLQKLMKQGIRKLTIPSARRYGRSVSLVGKPRVERSCS